MNRIYLLLLTLFLPAISQAQGIDQTINDNFMPIAQWWEDLVFSEITIGSFSIPLVLVLLLSGATLFTFYFGFVNIRRFPMAIQVVRGKYDEVEGADKPIVTQTVHQIDGDIVDTIKEEGHQGEVNHFQALATAVSVPLA